MRMPQLSCLANPRCAGPKPARAPPRALGRRRTDLNTARAASSRHVGRRRARVTRGPSAPAGSLDEAADAAARRRATAHGSQGDESDLLATRGPPAGARYTRAIGARRQSRRSRGRRGAPSSDGVRISRRSGPFPRDARAADGRALHEGLAPVVGRRELSSSNS